MESFFKKKSNIVLLINYVGRLFAAAITFFLLPTFLSLPQIGLYGGIHHMVFFFARLNLGQSIIFYGARLKGRQQEKTAFLGWGWFSSTLFYLFVLGLFFVFKSPLIAFFSLKASSLGKYIPLVLFLGYIVMLNVVLKSWAIALGRVVWVSFFQHVVINLLLIVLIVCYGWGWISFKQLLCGTSLPYMINLLLLLGELWWKRELNFSYDRRIFNRSFIFSFLKYSFFTLLSSSMAMFMIRIDNLMVFSMCGQNAEGMYHTITFMVLLLEVPIKVVKQTRASGVVQFFEKNDYEGLGVLYKKVTRWQFIVTGICFILLYSCIDYILVAFPKEVVSEMKQIFFFLGIAKLLDSLCRMASEILLLSRHFIWATLSGALLVFGTIANYYMINEMGVQGAPLATVLMLLLGGGINALIVWKKLGLHPLSWKLLYWGGCMVAILMALYFFHATIWVDS